MPSQPVSHNGRKEENITKFRPNTKAVKYNNTAVFFRATTCTSLDQNKRLSGTKCQITTNYHGNKEWKATITLSTLSEMIKEWNKHVHKPITKLCSECATLSAKHDKIVLDCEGDWQGCVFDLAYWIPIDLSGMQGLCLTLCLNKLW